VCLVSEAEDADFPVYLAHPVTGFTGGLEKRFRKCFLSPYMNIKLFYNVPLVLIS
jgi:hypothetical protein